MMKQTCLICFLMVVVGLTALPYPTLSAASAYTSTDTVLTTGEDTTFLYESDDEADTAVTATSDEAIDGWERAAREWWDDEGGWFKKLMGPLGILGSMLGIFIAFAALLFVLALLTSPLWLLLLALVLLLRHRRRNDTPAVKAASVSAPVSDAAAALAGDTEASESQQTHRSEPRKHPRERWENGVRQCFLGIGLIIFFVSVGWEELWGIGALVLCLGAAQLFIYYSSSSPR